MIRDALVFPKGRATLLGKNRNLCHANYLLKG
jgi:hypothetical protein